MGRFDVHLGESEAGPLNLSKEARDVHLQVVGLSRQGKSYFLEHLIRQDIESGAGVCVLDPHGELYANMVEWLAVNEMHKKRRIHLIHPAAAEWSVGFNPLCQGKGDVSARVGAMIDACQKVWGDEESGGHKTLARLLDLVFSTLAARQLSVREAALLTTKCYKSERDRLVAEIDDDDITTEWAEIDALGDRERAQRFEAVHNRLRELTRTPGIRSMLGQTDHLLSFKTCMDRGHIVLVNLAHEGKIKPQVAQTLGALITADLFYSAQTRRISDAKAQPFYCYIDECGDYLNETIVKGLDQTAKFGLHYVLSHQRLSQLGDRRDHPIRNGVVGGTQSKVVFLQDDLDTANELGELLFGKSFDLERPKEILIKPTVIGYTREWMASEGEATGEGWGQSSGSGIGLGTGMSMPGFDNATPTSTETESESEFSSESSSESHVRSWSRSEALVPIMKDLPTGTYSLDELRHLAAREIRLLQKRQAFVYRADDRKAIQFATSDVWPARPTAGQIDAFFGAIREKEPTANRTESIEALVIERRRRLLQGEALVEGDFWD